MRTYLLMIAAFLAGLELSARMVAGAEDFPYTAYVTVDQAEVRSGPSRTHYTTFQLFAGDAVEVYRRDAAGWLGIRPPAESFSWIPADVAEETNEPGIVRVLVETPAFIGSPLVAIREHKYQVKVRAGELVEVLGEKTLPGEEGDETWLKIAPPAGEFRWIHTNQVSRTPPRDEDVAERRASLARSNGPRGVSETQRSLPEMQAAIGTGVNRARESLLALTAASEMVNEATRDVRPVPQAILLTDLKPKHEPATERERSLPQHNDIRLVEHQQAVETKRQEPVEEGDGFVPRKPRRIENSAGVPAPSSDLRMSSRTNVDSGFRDSTSGSPRMGTYAGGAAGSLPATSSPAFASPGGISRGGGITAAQPRSLRVDGPMFDSAAASEKLRQLDLELSLHIAQPRATWNLEPIRSQAQKIVDAGETPTERGQARLLLEKIRRFEETFDVPNDPLIAAQKNSGTAADARYDGVGLLQPVLSRAGQSAVAPYAIVDRDGNPVAFVSPGPGMNLRRYENKPVGIYGKRGMIEAIRKPHLVAERVIDLSQR
jgi:uncharacterized protein YgiM (DUF1202 family)